MKTTKKAPGVSRNVVFDEVGFAGDDVMAHSSHKDLYFRRYFHVTDFIPEKFFVGDASFPFRDLLRNMLVKGAPVP